MSSVILSVRVWRILLRLFEVIQQPSLKFPLLPIYINVLSAMNENEMSNELMSIVSRSFCLVQKQFKYLFRGTPDQWMSFMSKVLKLWQKSEEKNVIEEFCKVVLECVMPSIQSCQAKKVSLAQVLEECG